MPTHRNTVRAAVLASAAGLMLLVSACSSSQPDGFALAPLGSGQPTTSVAVSGSNSESPQPTTPVVPGSPSTIDPGTVAVSDPLDAAALGFDPWHLTNNSEIDRSNPQMVAAAYVRGRADCDIDNTGAVECAQNAARYASPTLGYQLVTKAQLGEQSDPTKWAEVIKAQMRMDVQFTSFDLQDSGAASPQTPNVTVHYMQTVKRKGQTPVARNFAPVISLSLVGGAYQVTHDSDLATGAG